MSLTATTAIDADKPKTVANNRVEDHEARIVQLETLLKHFATGIITSPALGTELSKDNGPLSAVKETNLVKAHNANLDVPEKPSTSPATSEGGEHLFNDIDAKENAISLSPMNVQTSVSVEQKNTPDDRARVVFRQWDEKTMNYIDRNVQPQIEMKQDETKVERAFTYRKILSQNGSIVQSSEIDIEDAILYDTIKRIIPQVYPPNFCKTWPALPFKIRLPFNLLVHCYDKLEEFSVADNSDTEAKKRHREDVRLLLEYVRTTTELVEYFKMRKESPNTIAFRYLWTLFPPGIEVVARPFFNQSQLFRTDHEPESTPEDPDERPQMWPLLAWCFDWTGSDWVKSFHEFEIEPYEREKEISALPCYPLKYYQDTNQTKPEEFRATVLEVGNKFKTFCELKGAARMVEYDDLAITVGKARSDALFTSDDTSSRSISASNASVKRPKITGRVIVDAEAWFQQFNSLHLGDKRPAWVCGSEEDITDDQVPKKPDGDWAAFCPPRFFGLALKTKTMAQFKLSSVGIITKKNTDPFWNELQLGDGEKEMLFALVEQQDSRRKIEKADIVADKGRSLVILLHGPPGVGKTLTAETIAMATGKPLFVVSVADVGLEAEGAEAKLEKVFDLASKWDAILLIDEADVFLESRSELTTPDRNALVSVLLRVLEYYSGTIMLTTNRITSLDPAVQSRIHMAIRYEDLDTEKGTKVFLNFLKTAGVSRKEDMDDLQNWFVYEAIRPKSMLNGREVRNLVSSAQSLAKQAGEKFDRKHLRKVFNMTEGFKEELREQTSEWKVQNQGKRK